MVWGRSGGCQDIELELPEWPQAAETNLALSRVVDVGLCFWEALQCNLVFLRPLVEHICLSLADPKIRHAMNSFDHVPRKVQGAAALPHLTANFLFIASIILATCSST